MSKPAVSVGCQHICPQHNHVGGAVKTGSGNVFYSGKAAARQNDPMLCKVGMDKIAQGSSTVFVNGLQAARLGDASIHGGKITEGDTAVFIG